MIENRLFLRGGITIARHSRGNWRYPITGGMENQRNLFRTGIVWRGLNPATPASAGGSRLRSSRRVRTEGQGLPVRLAVRGRRRRRCRRCSRGRHSVEDSPALRPVDDIDDSDDIDDPRTEAPKVRRARTEAEKQRPPGPAARDALRDRADLPYGQNQRPLRSSRISSRRTRPSGPRTKVASTSRYPQWSVSSIAGAPSVR